MQLQALLGFAITLPFLPLGHAISGRSFTGWDCCKPGCAWQASLKNVQGSPKVCNINNQALNNGLNAASGCQSGGPAYLCDSYAPTPVTNDLAYGFATMNGHGNCCKCFQLTWTSGTARGKQMVVQAINNFDPSGDVQANDIVLLIPGGGSGPNEAGCRNQYGTTWGNSGGGLTNGQECANLPQNLQGGCYFRWNWARGPINTWNIDYQQVTCPQRLTQISGCSA
ncbi:hypothetical protein OQA88_6118 [Cercophora sp. LCS_1]